MSRQIDLPLNEDSVTVVYDYQPEESQTRDYPGCPLEITIEDVLFYNKTKDNGLFVTMSILNVLSDLDIEDLEEKIRCQYE